MKALAVPLLAGLLLAAPAGAWFAVEADVAGGRTDRAVDRFVDAVGAPRVTLPGDVRDGEEARTFTWTHRGVPYSWTVGVDADVAREYGERPRTLDPRHYGVYVTDADEDAVVARLAAGLEAAAEKRGLHGLDRANFVLAFVQGGVTYALDPATMGVPDYPRYPVETVFGQRGDCEDAAALYVSVMRAMGFDAALLLMDGHMAAGVILPEAPGPRFQGYAYAEATVPGYRVGEVPEQFGGKPVTPLAPEERPALAVAWDVDAHAHGWVVRLDVWNNGTADARGVQVQATARTAAGDHPGSGVAIAVIPVGGHETRWVWVQAPGDGMDTELSLIAWARNAAPVGGSVQAPAAAG